ncbi:MAG: recombinase family protein [Xanthobacteraceae bacterium]
MHLRVSDASYASTLPTRRRCTTPAGKAMFQMLGVFAEFERSIIQERVRAGLRRAKAEGKTLGRLGLTRP